ncbi:unnamed protein product [marine sediment metagenome]|uniref:Uncharacterized protein n=1 Tax=marine sediment metagenome TaxID=412755 RepID=X0Z9H9_9ZZZZ
MVILCPKCKKEIVLAIGHNIHYQIETIKQKKYMKQYDVYFCLHCRMAVLKETNRYPVREL